MSTTTSGFKPLGSEPAAIVSGIEAAAAAILTILTALHVGGLSDQQVGLILACLSAVLGVVVAAVTKHTTLSGIVAAVKTVAALAVGFGLHLTPESVAVVVGAITSIGGLYLRTQTSSLETKLTRSSVTKAA